MIYNVKSPPSEWPWKHFSPKEVACKCCGEIYLDKASMNAIQHVRDILGVPLHLNSAHRCVKHNKDEGGGENSEHLKIAFDISLRNLDKWELVEACKKAGFKGFGYYSTFLHVDMGRARFWYENLEAKEFWNKT